MRYITKRHHKQPGFNITLTEATAAKPKPLTSFSPRELQRFLEHKRDLAEERRAALSTRVLPNE